MKLPFIFLTFCFYLGSQILANSEPLPFNRPFPEHDLKVPISYVDTGKAISAVALHRGLLIVPLGADHGGGRGLGALAVYNIDNPAKPVAVFDSRDHMDLYHREESLHYLGNASENHGVCISGDIMLMPERGRDNAGFCLLDLGPLYDDDPETLPFVISRFFFPDVKSFTSYDGHSFSPTWSGGSTVYAPTGSHGLYVVDTRDLKHPKLLARLPRHQLFNQTLRSAHILGNRLILSPVAVNSADQQMVIMDVSNPSAPTFLSRHSFRTGYQGALYGTRFYNGAIRNEIIAYDFSNPREIQQINIATVKGLFRPEYSFLKDGDLFIGQYAGLSKYRLTKDGAEHLLNIEPLYPPRNDYAFVTPVGNLVAITSDHTAKSRLNIGVHDREPDRLGPSLVAVIPEMGDTEVDTTAHIGLSFSDFMDATRLNMDHLRLRRKGIKEAIPFRASHQMGVVSIAPVHPLKEQSTYELVVTGTLRDVVHNAYVGEHVLTTFSTGPWLNAINVELNVDEPKHVGDSVRMMAKVLSNHDQNDLSFAWDFGDGTTITPYSKDTTTQYRYQEPGNHKVVLHVKSSGLKHANKFSNIQVVTTPAMEPRPSSSSSFMEDTSTGRVFVANADNDTVTAIQTSDLSPIFEVAVGKQPVSLCVVGNEIWVSCRDADRIDIIDTHGGKLLGSLPMGHGRAPSGLLHLGHEKSVVVVLEGTGEILKIDVDQRKVTSRTRLGGHLRHLAHSPKWNHLIVPEFIASGNRGAKVHLVDANSFSLVGSTELPHVEEEDGAANGRGYPNYLGQMASDAAQDILWLPGKKDNLHRGLKRDGKPLVFDHTVRSMVTALDLKSGRPIEDLTLDLDNSDFATAMATNPLGNLAVAATMGSTTLWLMDAFTPDLRVSIDAGGFGPTSMAFSNDGHRLYVHLSLDRTLAIFDVVDHLYLEPGPKVKLVRHEKMSSEVLKGKRIFNNSRDPHLSGEGYMSCASCHFDGSHDGRTWDLSSMGEGLRNTIDLRGKAGMEHGPLHWTANFDEVQDFELQIRKLSMGLGLIKDTDFKKNYVGTHDPLGLPKAGVSSDLDALAAYVQSLDRVPKSPHRNPDGSMTASALAGRKHFIKMGCMACHRGDAFTDSAIGRFHDVGTRSEGSGQRLSADWLGLDTPSLLGLWQSSPYGHDGSAGSLDAFLYSESPRHSHQAAVSTLNDIEFEELKAFLMQIEDGDGIRVEEVEGLQAGPIFTQDSYDFSLLRTHEGSIPVGHLRAKGGVGHLRYYLMAGGDAAHFHLDSKSGELIFKNALKYFREKTLTFQVMVEDTQRYPQTAIADVVVKVLTPMLEPVKNLSLRRKNDGMLVLTWTSGPRVHHYNLDLRIMNPSLKKNKIYNGKAVASKGVFDDGEVIEHNIPIKESHKNERKFILRISSKSIFDGQKDLRQNFELKIQDDPI